MSTAPPEIDYGIIGSVAHVNDLLTLRVIEAIAHEKAKAFASGESE